MSETEHGVWKSLEGSVFLIVILIGTEFLFPVVAFDDGTARTISSFAELFVEFVVLLDLS